MNFFNNNISIDEYIKIKNYAYKSVEFFKKLCDYGSVFECHEEATIYE